MKKLATVLILIFLACANHSDPPAPLSIIEPPEPTNVTSSSPSPGVYDLSWDIGDSTVVSYYNLYYYDFMFGPQWVDTTAATSIQLYVGGAISGILWGVSSVTIENVESNIVYASE